jgi:hypothetical protein
MTTSKRCPLCNHDTQSPNHTNNYCQIQQVRQFISTALTSGRYINGMNKEALISNCNERFTWFNPNTFSMDPVFSSGELIERKYSERHPSKYKVVLVSLDTHSTQVTATKAPTLATVPSKEQQHKEMFSFVTQVLQTFTGAMAFSHLATLCFCRFNVRLKVDIIKSSGLYNYTGEGNIRISLKNLSAPRTISVIKPDVFVTKLLQLVGKPVDISPLSAIYRDLYNTTRGVKAKVLINSGLFKCEDKGSGNYIFSLKQQESQKKPVTIPVIQQQNTQKRTYRKYPKSFNKTKPLAGNRPPFDMVKFENRLEKYDIPKMMNLIMKRNDTMNPFIINEQLEKQYASELNVTTITPDNYTKFFKLLLFLEEVQLLINIRQYDQENTRIKSDPSNRYLHIVEAPGLAEKRPSVLRGDCIMLFHEKSNLEYKGYVYYVNLRDVRVSFHHTISNNVPYTVTFSFCRTPFKLMQRALENKSLISRLLSSNIQMTTPIAPYTSNKLNSKQVECVRYALDKPKHPILLYGPPGTGKTTVSNQQCLSILTECF